MTAEQTGTIVNKNFNSCKRSIKLLDEHCYDYLPVLSILLMAYKLKNTKRFKKYIDKDDVVELNVCLGLPRNWP